MPRASRRQLLLPVVLLHVGWAAGFAITGTSVPTHGVLYTASVIRSWYLSIQPRTCTLRMNTESQEPDSLRQKYLRDREAREKMFLPTQVNTAEGVEDEAPPDYEQKDREFRVRNGMVAASVDSEWADEFVNLQSAPQDAPDH